MYCAAQQLFKAFTTDLACFFLYCTLAARGQSNRNYTCSDNGSPICEDDSGVTGSVPKNSQRISISVCIHNQKKELICYGPLHGGSASVLLPETAWFNRKEVADIYLARNDDRSVMACGGRRVWVCKLDACSTPSVEGHNIW